MKEPCVLSRLRSVDCLCEEALGEAPTNGSSLAFAVGIMAICLLGLAVVGVICFGVYRWATRSKRQASPLLLPRLPTLNPNVPTPVRVESYQNRGESKRH